MNQIIEQLLYLQLQAKIFHWQTTSFAQHSAFGKFYDSLTDLIDQLVETFQGKYKTRIEFNKSIQLKNLSNVNVLEALDKAAEMLAEDFDGVLDPNMKNTELQNIRDEIKTEINQLKYLLTLE